MIILQCVCLVKFTFSESTLSLPSFVDFIIDSFSAVKIKIHVIMLLKDEMYQYLFDCQLVLISLPPFLVWSVL